jgi:hypothetical protein
MATATGGSVAKPLARPKATVRQSPTPEIIASLASVLRQEIAFSSDGFGSPQSYLEDLASRSPVPFTDLPKGAAAGLVTHRRANRFAKKSPGTFQLWIVSDNWEGEQQ